MVDRSDAATFETAFHSEPHDTRQPDTSEHEPIMVAATEAPAAAAPQVPAAVGGFAVEKVETFDAAAVKLQITAEDGKIIELPADAQISAILVNGDDLLIKEVNGDLILIKGGLKHMPTLHLGTIEIPSAALSASLTANGVTLPAAGDQGNAQGQNKSSGNHFGPDAGNIGDPFHVHGLLPFSEIDRGFGNLPPLQGGVARVNHVPTAGEAAALVDDGGLKGGNGGSDVPADLASFSGTLGGDVGLDGAGANGFSFAGLDGQSGIVGQEAVTYSWDAVTDTLTATGPRGDLFSVHITDVATGSYMVTLLDNVLQAQANDGETPTTVTLNYTITDADGSVAPTNSLVITLVDDVPINNDTGTVTVAVYEDGLNNANAVGNLDAGSNAVSATITASSLATLVSAGADAPVTIDFNAALSGNTGLTQNGVAITWHVVSATEIDGVIGGNNSKVAFTLVKGAGGDFTFTLLDNVDHSNASGDTSTVSLSLAGVFTATDTDKDAVVIDASATVTIQNDVPLAPTLTGTVAGIVIDETPGVQAATGDVLGS